jgi:hypothetical protein
VQTADLRRRRSSEAHTQLRRAAQAKQHWRSADPARSTIVGSAHATS